MLKFKGIEEAVKVVNKGKYVKVYYNVKTCEVWAIEYIDRYCCTSYKNPNIYMLDFEKAYRYDENLLGSVGYRFEMGGEWDCQLLTRVINACIKSSEVLQKKELNNFLHKSNDIFSKILLKT